jgi:GNAT superfamily N-acetyltransferase
VGLVGGKKQAEFAEGGVHDRVGGRLPSLRGAADGELGGAAGHDLLAHLVVECVVGECGQDLPPQRRHSPFPSAGAGTVATGSSSSMSTAVSSSSPGAGRRPRGAGVELDEYSIAGIDDSTLGSTLLDALHTDPRVFYDHFLDSLKEPQPSLIEQLVPLSLVLVAEHTEGNIVGACEVLPPASAIVSMRDMGYPPLLGMMLALTVGKVRGLAVDDTGRGPGWGSALLKRAVQVYDQLGFVTLHGSFDADSTRLEYFYRAHGFDVLGVGEKIEMTHLGPQPQTGSDPTECMFACHRDPNQLPWGDVIAGR